MGRSLKVSMGKNLDLKLRLKEIGVKKKELADALEVTPTQLSNIINTVEIVDYEKQRIISTAEQLKQMKNN